MSREPAASFQKYELDIPKGVTHQSKYEGRFYILLFILGKKFFKENHTMALKAIKEAEITAAPFTS